MLTDEQGITKVTEESFNSGLPIYLGKTQIRELAKSFLEPLPLPRTLTGTPDSDLARAITCAQKESLPLIICSTVCPPYETDGSGRPTYSGISDSLTFNIEQHFSHIPSQVKMLESNGVDAIHFFLMADTEVDLLPFLGELQISPTEFTAKCQNGVVEIAKKVQNSYGFDIYDREGIPPAARFLEYFGHETWFLKYEHFVNRLNSEIMKEPNGKIARGIAHDLEERKILIKKLLGEKSTHEQQFSHIVRQKAQYMTFATLMRERFGGRLVVVNHRTPNLAYMNDKIAREPNDPVQLENGNYLAPTALIELDISTLPVT